MKKILTSLSVIFLFLIGCNFTPEKARDGIDLAYGFIGDLQTRHLASCQANTTQTICVTINKGVALQRVAAGALNDYCSGPPPAGVSSYQLGGPCSPLPGLQSRLEAALSNLNNTINDLKKLGGN